VNRKIIVISVALMAIAMLALSVSPAYATKPETMTLTGRKIPTGIGDFNHFPAGESGNSQIKMKDCLDTWVGGIKGTGHYYGSWLVKPSGEVNMIGYWIFEGATVAGVGTGDLRIGQNGLNLWIESGSGDLSSIRGRGTATLTLPYYILNWEIVIQINP
jgi:hypothetical protein